LLLNILKCPAQPPHQKVERKSWKSLFRMIPSWELIGRGNKDLQPPTAVNSPPAVESIMLLSPAHAAEPAGGELLHLCCWRGSTVFRRPPWTRDELLNNEVGGPVLLLSAACKPRALCNPNELQGLISGSESSLPLKERPGIFVLTYAIGIEILSKWRITLSATTLEISICLPVCSSLTDKVKSQSLSYTQYFPFLREQYWVMDHYTHTHTHTHTHKILNWILEL
jgi:hypothetical protein